VNADYISMAELQNGRREQDGATSIEVSDSQLTLRYRHPRLPYVTAVNGGGMADWNYSHCGASASLHLPRQQAVLVRLQIRAEDFQDCIGVEPGRQREASLGKWERRTTAVTSDARSPFTRIVSNALHDMGSFALLEGAEEEWLAPGAGVPAYLALWGRDAVTAVWQSALFDRGAMAAAALARTAALQGQKTAPERDEEPGRIIHSARTGPLERLGRTPFARYYGDQASPFDFIFALAHAYACSGEISILTRHWDAARRILDWAREYGDRDGDGYLEYLTHSRQGPENQGWKDSGNAMVHGDGRKALPPLAACEVQGYYFAALQVMAGFSGLLGEPGTAIALWRQATELRERFNRDFWMEDDGFIALALDAEKEQLRTITSNVGQCLATGIITREHLQRVVRRLFESDLFSGWGIRTLSTKNPGYNPLDYHVGSIWPVENATIVFGLRRFGFDNEALTLIDALYDLAMLWPNGRIPECVGGYDRANCAHPAAYPRANVAQLWNQSGWLMILQAMLGLQPMAPLETMAVDPALPRWLPEITLHRLRLGSAVVTLRFRRSEKGDVHVEVLKQEGTLHIIRQPSPNSISTGIWDRLGSLFKSPVGH